jgi:hypothetical protein
MKKLIALVELNGHDVVLDPAIVDHFQALPDGGSMVHFEIKNKAGELDTGVLHVEETVEEITGLFEEFYDGPEMWTATTLDGRPQGVRAAHVVLVRFRGAFDTKPDRSMIHLGGRVLMALELPEDLADAYDVPGIFLDAEA